MHEVTGIALHSNLATERLHLTLLAYFAVAISILDAFKAGLDPVALSVLMSFMAIALPLVPLDDIIAMESHKAAKILVTVLARDGKGLGVVWCA